MYIKYQFTLSDAGVINDAEEYFSFILGLPQEISDRRFNVFLKKEFDAFFLSEDFKYIDKKKRFIRFELVGSSQLDIVDWEDLTDEEQYEASVGSSFFEQYPVLPQVQSFVEKVKRALEQITKGEPQAVLAQVQTQVSVLGDEQGRVKPLEVPEYTNPNEWVRNDVVARAIAETDNPGDIKTAKETLTTAKSKGRKSKETYIAKNGKKAALYGESRHGKWRMIKEGREYITYYLKKSLSEKIKENMK